MLASRLTRGDEAAKDIVAEVFLQLWERRHSLDHVQNLNAYLFVSTRNKAFNYLKSQTLRAAGELTEKTMVAGEPSAEEFFKVLLHTETIRALRASVEALPPECKKVIDLVFKGHPTSEIAGMLGISASAVSHQKARAIRILKDNMLLTVLLTLPMTFSAL